MNLILHLKKEYFEQIARGEKTEEYRLVTTYWSRRLEGRQYENVVLMCGYPKRGDTSKTMVLPWRGVCKKVIVHPLFSGGKLPTEVFAIDVRGLNPYLCPHCAGFGGHQPWCPMPTQKLLYKEKNGNRHL